MSHGAHLRCQYELETCGGKFCILIPPGPLQDCLKIIALGMKKCKIYKKKFGSDSLQHNTVKGTRNLMNIFSFLFSVSLQY